MADLLEFPTADEDVAIEPDEPTIEPTEPAPPAAIAPLPLVEVLPADFRLSPLVKFVPNPALRRAADEAGTYALGLTITGPDGLQTADVALSAVRASLKAIEEQFAEPVAIANDLHKRLTTIRGEWCARGKQAIEVVGRRIYDEQRRLEAVAAEERRKAQAEADRHAREAARRQAEEAARQQAPAPVVEELQRQAETATAPPVSVPAATPPPLKGSTTVTTWKARLVGTSGADDPNPGVEMLSAEQRRSLFALMHAVLDGKAPLACVEINWPYLNKRARADKGTLAIAGIEAFEEGSVRAKSTRLR